MSRVVEVTQYGTAATGGRRLKVEVARAGRPGPAGSGVTDHGALTGLGDDDHPQYQHANPTFTSTSPFTITDESFVLTTGSAVTLPDATSNAGRTVLVGAAAVVTTVSPAGTDSITTSSGNVTSYRVLVSSGVAFTSLGTGGWVVTNEQGLVANLPPWYDVQAGTNSITQGHVVKMGASAPEWGAASGTGDVVGPASSVDNRVALFDGTTGKLLKQSAAALASVATSGSASDLSAGTVPTARLSTKVLGGQDEGGIVTATTATSLLDSTITVSGAAGDLIEVVAGYRFLNSSGTTKAPTITLKLGATTVLTYTPSAQSSSATDRQGHFRAAIRLESTTDQNVSGLGFIASGITALTGTSTENLGTGVALDLTGAVQSGGSQEVQLHFVTITRVAA